MLVLSRQRDESIFIGDNIKITIVDIRGDKVRLGINAPTRISVHRKEVYDSIRAENARAATIHSSDLSALKAPPVPERRVASGSNGVRTTAAAASPAASVSGVSRSTALPRIVTIPLGRAS